MILATANHRKSSCILLDILFVTIKSKHAIHVFGLVWPALVPRCYAVSQVETSVWMRHGTLVLFGSLKKIVSIVLHVVGLLLMLWKSLLEIRYA